MQNNPSRECVPITGAPSLKSFRITVIDPLLLKTSGPMCCGVQCCPTFFHIMSCGEHYPVPFLSTPSPAGKLLTWWFHCKVIQNTAIKQEMGFNAASYWVAMETKDKTPKSTQGVPMGTAWGHWHSGSLDLIFWFTSCQGYLFSSWLWNQDSKGIWGRVLLLRG